MSVAGGISKAVDRAEAHGCEALQIFTKNGNRWLGPPLDRDDVKRFRARIEETGPGTFVPEGIPKNLKVSAGPGCQWRCVFE